MYLMYTAGGLIMPGVDKTSMQTLESLRTYIRLHVIRWMFNDASVCLLSRCNSLLKTDSTVPRILNAALVPFKMRGTVESVK